eukprot:g40502.t1
MFSWWWVGWRDQNNAFTESLLTETDGYPDRDEPKTSWTSQPLQSAFAVMKGYHQEKVVSWPPDTDATDTAEATGAYVPPVYVHTKMAPTATCLDSDIFPCETTAGHGEPKDLDPSQQKQLDHAHDLNHSKPGHVANGTERAHTKDQHVPGASIRFHVSPRGGSKSRPGAHDNNNGNDNRNHSDLHSSKRQHMPKAAEPNQPCHVHLLRTKSPTARNRI